LDSKSPGILPFLSFLPFLPFLPFPISSVDLLYEPTALKWGPNPDESQI
jgi:hypothetical protein